MRVRGRGEHFLEMSHVRSDEGEDCCRSRWVPTRGREHLLGCKKQIVTQLCTRRVSHDLQTVASEDRQQDPCAAIATSLKKWVFSS